jgi:hypothetical protein
MIAERELESAKQFRQMVSTDEGMWIDESGVHLEKAAV